jgi:hypothetical protein
MMMSVDECHSMVTVVVNHARVLATRSALVAHVQTRYHQ